MILMIILFTIWFCHSIVRVSMVMLRSARDEEQGLRVSNKPDQRGYAQPQRPIQVVLARDEQIGIGGTAGRLEGVQDLTPPPPVYGVWRDSVVRRIQRSHKGPYKVNPINRKPIRIYYIGNTSCILHSGPRAQPSDKRMSGPRRRIDRPVMLRIYMLAP